MIFFSFVKDFCSWFQHMVVFPFWSNPLHFLNIFKRKRKWSISSKVCIALTYYVWNNVQLFIFYLHIIFLEPCAISIKTPCLLPNTILQFIILCLLSTIYCLTTSLYVRNHTHKNIHANFNRRDSSMRDIPLWM